MDISRTYDLETSHQLTLGYDDANASYCARLVTVEPNPQTIWSYKPPETYLQSELEYRPLEVMLAFAQEAVRQQLDGKTFVLPDQEYERLHQAPSITPIKSAGSAVADTDYADRLQAVQMTQRATVLRELITVAERLEEWQAISAGGELSETILASAQEDLLACSASKLVERSPDLAALLEWDELTELGNIRTSRQNYEIETQHRLDDILRPGSLERLDAFIAEQTGGIALTGFPILVSEDDGLSGILSSQLRQIEEELGINNNAVAPAVADAAPTTVNEEQIRSLAVLDRCINSLRSIQQQEQENLPYPTSTTEEIRNSTESATAIEGARGTTLALAALELASTVETLSQRLPESFAEDMLSSNENRLWDISVDIQPAHLSLIDSYVHSLCGTPLTQFPAAIANSDALGNRIQTALVSSASSRSSGNTRGFDQALEAVAGMTLAWQAETASNNDLDPIDQAAEHADVMTELEHCVFELVNLRDYERGEIEDTEPARSIEQRRSNILAQTAAMVASNVYGIASELTPSTFTTMANSDGINDWDIYTLLDERELGLINDYCASLCRTRFTDFPLAVQRGYDPTNGVPLEYRDNPERYDPAALFPSPQTETLYQNCGMTAEQAAEVARIQRLDLRDRTEEDWRYLSQQHTVLMASPMGQDRA